MTTESPIRIRHLSFSDLDGGAARAAYRLHGGMVAAGADSKFLVRHKLSDDQTVLPLYGSRLGQFLSYHRAGIDRLPVRVLHPRLQAPWFFSNWVPDLLSSHSEISRADVIQLHWVSGGFLRPESLMSFKKPLFWRLSDFWPFSGGCHYPADCMKYERTCGACPQLGSLSDSDISRWCWNRKNSAYQGLNLTVVAPSNWIADCARKSSLFNRFPVEVIHNGIDLQLFRPIRRESALEALGLPTNRRYILFGAIHGTSDERKGFTYLREALKQLQGYHLRETTELLIFGSTQPIHSSDLGFPVRSLGVLKDNLSLVIAYNAADVFVAPSIEENFSSTVLEAVACGRPVVVFNTGGMPDLVTHQQNGFLATVRDAADLAAGIQWVLDDQPRQEALGKASRTRAEIEFSLPRQTEKYLYLYKSAFEKTKSQKADGRISA